jgi:hypothetical protein
MTWLASFVAMLVQKLAPWIWATLGTVITGIVAYFTKKKHDAEDAKQREEATKNLDEAIKSGVPRDERQKAEENLLNS